MNCSEIRPLFHAYVDHELDVVRSVEMEQHLKNCPTCATARRSVLAMRTALQQNNLSYRAPDSLRRSVRQITREVAPVPSIKAGVSALWRWLAIGATACTLLLLVLHPVGGNDPLLEEAVSSHVRSLMAEHLMDVASTDQHTVKPWFNGKLDFAPEVKDFTAEGFPLIGGRLDYLDHQVVAALVYRHGKHVINVFVWPQTGSGSKPAQAENLRGYSVINCNVGGLRYCLVSDLNAKELNDLADLLIKQ